MCVAKLKIGGVLVLLAELVVVNAALDRAPPGAVEPTRQKASYTSKDDDKTRLQGTWYTASVESHGRKVPAERIVANGVRLVIESDRWTLRHTVTLTKSSRSALTPPPSPKPWTSFTRPARTRAAPPWAFTSSAAARFGSVWPGRAIRAHPALTAADPAPSRFSNARNRKRLTLRQIGRLESSRRLAQGVCVVFTTDMPTKRDIQRFSLPGSSILRMSRECENVPDLSLFLDPTSRWLFHGLQLFDSS